MSISTGTPNAVGSESNCKPWGRWFQLRSGQNLDLGKASTNDKLHFDSPLG